MPGDPGEAEGTTSAARRLRERVLARLSPSGRGVFTILGGTAGGQALALAVAPVLSRLYSPSDFGVFTILSSLVAVVGTVSTLRFDLAIPLPKRERDAQGLVALGLISTAVTFGLTSAIVGLGGADFARAFGQSSLMPWLWFVPMTSCLMGVYLVLNQLAIRHRRYKAIGRRNLLQSAAMVATQVLAGLVGMRAGGLVLGLGVGQATSALSLVGGSGLFSADAKEGRHRDRLRAVARRYRRFPLILTASGLLNVLGLQLPVLLIAYWYGSSVAGWTGLTQRVLSLPVMLVGTAIAQVYIGELSRVVRDDPAGAARLFRATSRRLLIAAAVPAIVLLVAGPQLFALVFGAEWRTSGQYAQALALSLASQLVAVPVSQTLTVLERQVTQLAWDGGRLVLLTAAVGASRSLGGSALTTLWAFGVSSAVAYCVSWILSYRAIGRVGPAVPFT